MNLKKVIGTGVIAVLVICAGCKHDPDPDPVFIQSQYSIPPGEIGDTLNIDPVFAYSSNESAAIAEILQGGVLITAKGKGYAKITISDFSCINNAAFIDVDVDSHGAITARITKFEGQLVTALIRGSVTVQGTTGSEITSANIRIMMDNNDFSSLQTGSAVNSWIKNLPGGLNASVSYIASGEHPHEITITLSGTPGKAYSGRMEITIPAEHTAMKVPVNVTPRDDAQFAIQGVF